MVGYPEVGQIRRSGKLALAYQNTSFGALLRAIAMTLIFNRIAKAMEGPFGTIECNAAQYQPEVSNFAASWRKVDSPFA